VTELRALVIHNSLNITIGCVNGLSNFIFAPNYTVVKTQNLLTNIVCSDLEISVKNNIIYSDQSKNTIFTMSLEHDREDFSKFQHESIRKIIKYENSKLK
jgi:hypothetical protein